MTVIVNNVGIPWHAGPEFEKDGVTVIMAVCGVVPVLVPVNEEIFPDPLAARPMEVFELTQL